MPERVRNGIAGGVILACLAIVAVTLASSPPRDRDRVDALASRLGCPVCESESIADSPSAIARDLLTLISEQVSDGWTDDEVVAFFVATYGEQVLLDPPLDRRTIALWLLPAAAAVIGLIVILGRLTAQVDRELTDAEWRRLDAELRDREDG